MRPLMLEAYGIISGNVLAYVVITFQAYVIFPLHDQLQSNSSLFRPRIIPLNAQVRGMTPFILYTWRVILVTLQTIRITPLIFQVYRIIPLTLKDYGIILLTCQTYRTIPCRIMPLILQVGNITP
jgi:hypothetical protein